ncbi:MAG: hypothetical protein FJ125_11680 [Deltaproteobacteria bacterium]|nr:hypothetical protein [Deltaproteobacteria bacterium]
MPRHTSVLLLLCASLALPAAALAQPKAPGVDPTKKVLADPYGQPLYGVDLDTDTGDDRYYLGTGVMLPGATPAPVSSTNPFPIIPATGATMTVEGVVAEGAAALTADPLIAGCEARALGTLPAAVHAGDAARPRCSLFGVPYLTLADAAGTASPVVAAGGVADGLVQMGVWTGAASVRQLGLASGVPFAALLSGDGTVIGADGNSLRISVASSPWQVGPGAATGQIVLRSVTATDSPDVDLLTTIDADTGALAGTVGSTGAAVPTTAVLLGAQDAGGALVSLKTNAATQAQSLSVTQDTTGGWTVRAQDGSGSALTSQAAGAQRPLDVQLLTAAGAAMGAAATPVRVDPTGSTAQPVSDGGSSLTVDGSVAATQSGTWSFRTQDGSGTAITSSAAGALRGLDVVIRRTDGAEHGTIGAPFRVESAQLPASLGQALMAASTPVAIASNQSAVPITGTVGVSSLPLLDGTDVDIELAGTAVVGGVADVAAGTLNIVPAGRPNATDACTTVTQGGADVVIAARAGRALVWVQLGDDADGQLRIVRAGSTSACSLGGYLNAGTTTTAGGYWQDDVGYSGAVAVCTPTAAATISFCYGEVW